MNDSTNNQVHKKNFILLVLRGLFLPLVIYTILVAPLYINVGILKRMPKRQTRSE